MKLATIILSVSSIVWILPIFRQYSTKLRYYFLIIGLADPVNILMVKVFGVKAGIVHAVASLLALLSLKVLSSRKFEKIYIEFLIILLFASALLISNYFYIIILIHILIFARILLYVTVLFHKNQILSGFYLVLLFYELTVITKLALYVSGTHSAIILAYITLAFELLIAVFFTVIREDHPRLRIRVFHPLDKQSF